MAIPKVDARLPNWDQLSEEKWSGLLLGNGFSINIWSKFSYGSLYELATTDKINFPLNDRAKKLFDGKDTHNFEEVLNTLSNAIAVDRVISGGQQRRLKILRTNIRKALASAIQYAHIPPNIANLNNISDELCEYNTVFTTNYDLIPYWAIMSKNTERFKDYFWVNGNEFDINNTAISGSDVTRILYLHGALHIIEDVWDHTRKNTTGKDTLLDQFPKTFKEESWPVFITEGNPNEKLFHILNSPYLRFAYEEFKNFDGAIVILGHSLNESFDQHLIDAMNLWKSTNIAFGIRSNLSNTAIIGVKARIHNALPGHTIKYFDSTTHPLTAKNQNMDQRAH